MVWWPLVPGVIAAAWEAYRHGGRVRPVLTGVAVAATARALTWFVTQVLASGWPTWSEAHWDPRVIGVISVLVLVGAALDVRRPRSADP